MRWILALVGALVGVGVGDEAGLLVGLALGGLTGYVIDKDKLRQKRVVDLYEPLTVDAEARIAELTARVERLERMVQALSRRHSVAMPDEPAAVDVPTPAQEPALTAPRSPAFDERGVPYEAPEPPAPPAEPTWGSPAHDEGARSADQAPLPQAKAALSPQREARAQEPSQPAEPDPIDRLVAAVRSFFFGGNTVVRVGVLVLTVGVGLLVKYAAENVYFPLELRLAAAALVGLSLIALGFRLRALRPGFGTALQGGGVGALYLVTFFAYYSYHLLPAGLTLGLLIGIAVLSSLLAVVQDALQLAVFGAIGGFLAPLLASRGGSSHVALFSYYALLNAAIAGMALFRAWRVLNWVGFVFTFGVASAWGALKYEPAHMASASFFLALFFLFYVLVGTLYALRQPDTKRGAVDTTLTFGTPLATLALAGGLYRLEHLYLALACVTIAAVYLGTARWLLARADATLRVLAQLYVAIGIGIATLAIPFALDGALATALAWAAEAAGLVWVGIKQQRLRSRVGGYVLFAGSLLALAAREHAASTTARVLFFVLIALALGLAATFVERARRSLRAWESMAGHGLFAAALALWLGALGAAIDALPGSLQLPAWLGAGALTTLLLELIGSTAPLPSARKVALVSLPLLLTSALLLSLERAHPFAALGSLAYLTWLAQGHVVLYRQREALAREPLPRDVLHASGAYALALLVLSEAHHVTDGWLGLASGWVDAACLLAPLGVAAITMRHAPHWPLGAHPRAYRSWTGWPLSLAVALAALILQGQSSGDAAPLPYLPLLSPLDLAQALVLVVLLSLSAREPRPHLRSAGRALAAACLFVGLNGIIVRTAHHWAGVPFRAFDVPSAPLVQASFSILWTVLSLIAMVLAHRKRLRVVWVVGASLLGATVLKLFLLDLARLSSVAKIVTFLAVGVLLLLIGYFAPVPPAASAASERS